MAFANRDLRVFLCHASQDKRIVRQLYGALLNEGWIDPWLDEEKLLPGQEWGIEIERAVEASDAVIVCLSRNSVTKEGYVQRELRFALDVALEKPESSIFIIPIRLDACEIPRRIKRWQYVDYYPEGEKARGYQKILKSLMRRAETLNAAVEEADSSQRNFSVYLRLSQPAQSDAGSRRGATAETPPWHGGIRIPYNLTLCRKASRAR